MNKLSKTDLQNMSVSERILMAEDIWDSIVESQSQEIEFTEAQRIELDRRLAVYSKGSESIRAWDTIKSEFK